MENELIMNTKPRRFLYYIIPQYDEVSLFAISFTCVLLFSYNALSVNWGESLDLERRDVFTIICMTLIFFLGLLLSIYHAFTDRSKSQIEKFFMLFFAVTLNAFSGFCAGVYALYRTDGWFIVFPILNIINAVILLFMFRTNIINEDSIADDNASLIQILFTAIIVVTLFVFCNYMCKLIWIQTLSVCVVYATNIGRRIQPLILQVTKN